MATYILKRFLQLIPVFLGATLLVYFLVFSLPGDPIVALFGDKPVNEAVAARLREQYHLDQPFWIQYLLYLKGIFTFDLGQDFSGRPIAAVLGEVFPVTARLAVMALIFEAVFGIIFGLIAGLRKGKFFDATVLIASLIVIGIPIFVLGFLLQFTIGVQLGWAKPTVSSAATVQDLILPAIVLGLGSFAYVLRLTRTIRDRKHERRLRPHRHCQGPVPVPRGPRAHPAQLADPGDHLPRRRPRRPDGRRHRHRRHLQRARRRQPALPRRHAG